MDLPDIQFGEILYYEFDTLYPEGLQNSFFDCSIPTTDLFTKCNGLEIDSETGAISLILERLETGGENLPQFSKEDIKLVIQNVIRNCNVAFEEPFQPILCKYMPLQLKDSSLLNTMIYAHKCASELFKLNLDLKVKEMGEQDQDLYTRIDFGRVNLVSRVAGNIEKYEFENMQIIFSLHTSDGDSRFQVDANEFSELMDTGSRPNPLLRLKELSRLICICRVLRGRRAYNEHMKTALELYRQHFPFELISPPQAKVIKQQIESISRALERFRHRWVPPHPIYSEQSVQKEWKVWQEINQIDRWAYEGRPLRPGWRDHILSEIRKSLQRRDNLRFDHCANSISKIYHVPLIKIHHLIPSYLEKDQKTLETLIELCCEGWRQHELLITEREIAELEKVGIHWNTAYQLELRMPYGGVNIDPVYEMSQSTEPPVSELNSNSKSVVLNLQSLLNSDRNPMEVDGEGDDPIWKQYCSELGVPEVTVTKHTNCDCNGSDREPQKVKGSRYSKKRRKSSLGKLCVFLLSWI